MSGGQCDSMNFPLFLKAVYSKSAKGNHHLYLLVQMVTKWPDYVTKVLCGGSETTLTYFTGQ